MPLTTARGIRNGAAPGRDALTCEHIVASISDPGAGTSYSVPALASGLAARGVKVRLHCVGGWRSDQQTPASPSGVETIVHPQDWAHTPLLRNLCASHDLERSLRVPGPERRIFHAHGLWLMPGIYPASAKIAANAAFVVSPRGMLGPEALAFSKARKAVFWRAFQRQALQSADCIHATSDAECDDVRAVGARNPVAVIPNGIAMPSDGAPTPRAGGGNRVVLSLGRIHPKKGLDQLIKAWAEIEPDHPDWRLRIVGPAEIGHDMELRSLAASLNLQNVSIEGPAYGDDKTAAYRDAALFVLPTRNENFAMTVAEALAHGVPVISTKGAPWAGLETERCGWWVDRDHAAIASALASAMSMPSSALQAMGARGRDWMARDFSWDRVAADMLDVYRWLAQGGERPATVRLDRV